MWMILRHALLLVLLGVAIGIPVAAAGSRILAHVLFGVRVGDPTTLATAVLGIALSAAVAAVIPGFRASRIDPMVTLRHE